MLYLLLNDKKQAFWQIRYEQTYCSLLDKIGYPYKILHGHNKELPVLHGEDFLWVMHYEDLDSPYVRSTAAKTIFRISGTSAHPYCYQVDSELEKEQLERITFNLSPHPRASSLIQKFAPKARIVDTGYPIYVPETMLREKIPKTIVVGGRLSPDKQFMLSCWLLQPYVDEGYTVTFCYPDNGGKDTTWINIYGGSERYLNRGFLFKKHSNEEWLNTLAESEFFFTASLGDTICCSCVEAVTLGCYPLTPKIGSEIPLYDTYLDQGYEPFSSSDLRRLIEQKPKLTVDRSWIDPSSFIERVVNKVLKNA